MISRTISRNDDGSLSEKVNIDFTIPSLIGIVFVLAGFALEWTFLIAIGFILLIPIAFILVMWLVMAFVAMIIAIGVGIMFLLKGVVKFFNL